MRRLALLALLGLAVAAQADSLDYLRLRAKSGVVQAVGPSALRELVGTHVLEIQGKVAGTCQSGAATMIVLQLADGETQAVGAKALPVWLADTDGPVRLLVRCERKAAGGVLTATFLSAAPELDVLPVEEAYWRGLAEARAKSASTATKFAARPGSRSIASRRGTTRGGIVGRIGGRSYAPPRGKDWVLPIAQVIDSYADFIRRYNPRLNPSQALSIAQSVVVLSKRYGIRDERLVMAVLIVESGFNPNAVSRTGAVGLGQLMPGTARGLGVQNSYNTVDNLSGAIRLLRSHLDAYGGDISLALAAYNAGAGAVRRHGGVPPYRETQNYVFKVTAIYRKLSGF